MIANVLRQPQDGDTALIVAARSGHAECVRLLVQNGAETEFVEKVYVCFSMMCFFCSCEVLSRIW